jgi:hypothetical protein
MPAARMSEATAMVSVQSRMNTVTLPPSNSHTLMPYWSGMPV